MDPHALGKLCVERRVLTEDQLEHCLAVQRSSPEWRRLGEVLLAEGFITGVALANLLSIQAALRGEQQRPAREGGAPAPATTTSPQNEAAEVPPTELAWFLKEALAQGATGLVLGGGQQPVLVRRDKTDLLDGPALRHGQIHTMISEAIPSGVVQRMERDGFAEATVDLVGEERTRVALYRYGGGVALSLRVLPRADAELRDLNLPAATRDFARAKDGLVLVTGPRGSGRTTTVAGMLRLIAETRRCHIVVLQSVREIELDSDGPALVTSRLIGRDSGSWADAIRSTLAADADVVAIGGLDEPDALTAALNVASSDRLVLGVMSTGGAAATVSRILHTVADLRVPYAADALAAHLRGIVAQRLFHPRRGDRPVVAAEVLRVDAAAANLIRSGKPDQLPTLMRTDTSATMISLEDALARLVKRGTLGPTEAVAAANDPDSMRRLLGLQKEGSRVGR